MVRQTYYVSRDQRHPLYKTRMLRAGEPLPLDASAARLYRQLGVELTEEGPKKPRILTTKEVLSAEVVDENARVAEAPATRAPVKKSRRRAAKKK